jgi:photosynthetic reaction center cytochrome c subunit
MRGALTATLGVVALGAAVFIVTVPDWTSLPVGTQLAPSPASQIHWDRGHIPEPVSQAAPAPLPAETDGGGTGPATSVYKNVQVLTDVNADEFMRLQHAITQWVSPQQGCGFCHTGTDYASDAKPEKQVARLMLRMVRHVNADWADHVSPAGVTCYTCHRGQPVPAEVWFPSTPPPVKPFIAKQEPYREDADTVRKFFPDAGWTEYLLEDTPISVQSTTALPSQTVASQIETKRIYEMMMQLSDGIGVNCGYCHNSRAFESWAQSTPARWIGYYGLKMNREINRDYLLQLSTIIPQTRQRLVETHLPVLPGRDYGPQRGNGFVVCATCHYGEPKPLGGAAMLHDYPGLRAAAAPAATGAAAVPAPPHG